jgi:hypothetical protein
MENKKHKFFCDKCNYSTNVSGSYKKHLETEIHKTGKRKTRSNKKCDLYECNKCDFTSKKEHNYFTHFLHNHATKEEKKLKFRFYCDNCDFGTFTESEYNKHVNTNKHKMKTV